MNQSGPKKAYGNLINGPEGGFDRQRLDFEEMLELFDVVDEIIGSDEKAKKALYGSFDSVIYHENFSYEELEENWGHLLPKDGEPQISDKTRINLLELLQQSMPNYTLDELEPVLLIAETLDTDTLAALLDELRRNVIGDSTRARSLLNAFILPMANRLRNEETQVKIALAEVVSSMIHNASFDTRACRQSPTDIALDHFKTKYPTFDFTKLKGIWLARFQDQLDPRSSIGKDLQRAVDLERATPGVTSVLMDELNITNIGRYPVELLLDQIEYRYDYLSPYCVLFSSGSDWNGSKYVNTEIDNYMDINAQLAKLGYRLRIAEFHSLEMLLEAQERFAQQYENPIEGVLVDAHGWKDGFCFARIKRTMTEQEQYARTIRTCDFNDPNAAPFKKKYYGANPTFIFFACSTGLEGGVAQAESRALGSTTIAPEASGHLKSMVITENDCGLQFDVEYEDADDEDGPLPVKTAVYQNGIKIQ